MNRIVGWAVTFVTATMGNAVAGATSRDASMAMDRVMDVASAAHLPGEIALSDVDGTMLDRALGTADRASGRQHKPGARWLWASVTKQVTAILVMQQVEAGTLALDGSISAYLPDFAGPAGRTTLRQLLQHVSGLPNPDDTSRNAEDVPSFYTETGRSIGDRARSMAFCAGSPKVGTDKKFSYNNCDYLVLGAILERVTGRSFADLVAHRIARPLGLRSLKMATDGERRGGSTATGYTADGKPFPTINVATFGAAGALTGTARDLLTLDRALLNGTLLKASSRAILWHGDPGLGYEALGVWSFPATLRGCAGPVDLIERRGDVGGTQVRNVMAPVLSRAIVVFTNDDAIDFGEIWQGKGLSFDLLSAAFCPSVKS